MGRRTKDFTEFEQKCHQKSAERVKALKEEQHTTFKRLAEQIGVADATVRNYVHLRSFMTTEVARLFQKYSGIIWPYWIGETDCKTWKEFEAEQEMILDSAMAEHGEEERRRIEQYEALFSLCGFQYDNLSYTPAYEFDPESEAEGPHQITNRDAPIITAVFSDSEIDGLFSRLHDMIELECYIKSNRERGEKKCHQ